MYAADQPALLAREIVMTTNDAQEPARRTGRLFVISGWVATAVGMILWGYGYLSAGTPPLVTWSTYLPAWAADWLPNLEAEIGMVLLVLGSIPGYWDMWRSR
jgi:hypothetical protein